MVTGSRDVYRRQGFARPDRSYHSQKELALRTGLYIFVDSKWLHIEKSLSGVHRTCPVNYSEAPLKIPEGAKFGLESLGAPDSPVRQTRAAFSYPLLFLLNPFLGLFIG